MKAHDSRSELVITTHGSRHGFAISRLTPREGLNARLTPRIVVHAARATDYFAGG